VAIKIEGQSGEIKIAFESASPTVRYTEDQVEAAAPGVVAMVRQSGFVDLQPKNKALQELVARRDSLLSYARSIKVTDPASFALAASVRRDLRKVKDTFEGLLRPGIKRLDQLHTQALDELKGYVGVVDETDKALKREQDTHQTQEKKRKEEEKRLQDEIMAAARDRILNEQLESALIEQSPEKVEEVLVRMATPAPVIPMVHVPVKAEGAMSRTIPTLTLIDFTRLNHLWLLQMIGEEIERKGECEWLTQQLKREVARSGKDAVEKVGVGSVEYDEVVSTGVRR
jgi:hypothetical protein